MICSQQENSGFLFSILSAAVAVAVVTAITLCMFLPIAVTAADGAVADNAASENAPLADMPEIRIPVGIEALESLDHLMYLRRGVQAFQVSSYDRTGKNNDGGWWDHFPPSWRYREGTDYVIFDAKGPGIVYNIWLTGIDGELTQPKLDHVGRIKIYFDGEAKPSIDMPITEFFSGKRKPFLNPLAGDHTVSSGGFFSFVPLVFEKSLKISTTAFPWYHHIIYHTFADGHGLRRYTGKEDYSKAMGFWSRLDSAPSGTGSVKGSGSLEPGSVAELAKLEGEGKIKLLRIKMPQIIEYNPPKPVSVEDNARSHKGVSRFTASIDPSNKGVKLVKRNTMSNGIQAAQVYVDGKEAGLFNVYESRGYHDASDVELEIPESITAGKKSISIELHCQNYGSDWIESRYWVYSLTDEGYVLTDEIDIGDRASEQRHKYSITDQKWTGKKTYNYPAPEDYPLRKEMEESLELMNNLWIKIRWDGEEEPSIEAPMGYFFGSGLGRQNVKSLPLRMGTDPEDWFECHFPMPYGRSAEILLENRSSHRVDEYEFELVAEEFPGARDLLERGIIGYLHAWYNEELPTIPGHDYLLLDEVGMGHYVGVVLTMGSTNGHRWYMEGDERFFIDGSRSPAFHGTGTEDYFLGGWYFFNGTFSQPLHGNPAHVVVRGGEDYTGVYRFHLGDVIPFYKSILLNLEHGFDSQVSYYYTSLAFWYGVDKQILVETDRVDVGSPESEQLHGYVINKPVDEKGNVVSPQDPAGILRLSASFEGTPYYRFHSDSGRMHKGSSEFTVAIDPANSGVKLRRLMDQKYRHQAAKVYVDDKLAGIWYEPGYDDVLRWKDSDFEISGRLTRGKSSIMIKIEWDRNVADGSADRWTEYEYVVYSYVE